MHDDPDEIGQRKRRSTNAVLIGLLLITLGMLLAGVLGDGGDIGSDLVSTAAAVAGFGAVMYGVHLGWQVYYDREGDGPAS